MATVPPQRPSQALHTVYLSNLSEKVKIPMLKENLAELLLKYGEIIEIRAASKLSLRGQAFVIFKDPESASSAVKSLNGCIFLGKPIVIITNDELPTHILMITNLPPSVTNKKMLEDKCINFEDFIEVRLVPNRLDVAYIEFENPMSATSAKTIIEKQNFTVSYAPAT